MPDGNDAKWRPLRDRLLSDEDLLKITEQYPRGLRRALDTKWGFTGILGELVRSNDPLFAAAGGLANGYSIASHILHADYIGTSIPTDRDLRSPDRRDSMTLAHANRLISDVMVCLKLRLIATYRFLNQDPASLAEADLKIDRLMESFGSVYEEWFATEYPAQPPEHNS